MDRRLFIKTVGAGAVVLSVGCAIKSAGKDRYSITPPEDETDAPFVNVGKDHNAPSLKRLLNRGSSKIITREKFRRMDEPSTLPSVIYSVKHELLFDRNERKAIFNPSGLPFGSGIVLDKYGHVLTAYHIIDKSRHQENISLILYEPHTGLAGNLEILSVSPEWDLALGKINFANPHTKPTYITKGDLKKGSLLQSLTYDPEHCLEVLPEVLDSFHNHGYIHTSLNRPLWSKSQAKLVKKSTGEMGLDEFYSEAVPFNDEGVFFMNDDSFFPGNSGTPIYSAHGDLVSIVQQSSEASMISSAFAKRFCRKHPEINCEDKYNLSVTPYVIRELLKHYISN